MADNTTLNPGAAGDVIRDIQRQPGGAKTQVIALDLGGSSGNPENLINTGQDPMANSLSVTIAGDQPSDPALLKIAELLSQLLPADRGLVSPFEQLAENIRSSIFEYEKRRLSNKPSYIAPIIGAFKSTGTCPVFSPISGRPFNISIWGTFSASVQLERTFDGANWLPLTGAGVILFVWTAPASEVNQEDEINTLYRLNCTSYTSGSANYRISQ